MIDDITTFTIEIRGQVDQDDINAASPLKVTVTQVEESRTILSACTDQSGVIGLIRHLHGMGLIIRSFTAGA
jgi:hypothetical protein